MKNINNIRLESAKYSQCDITINYEYGEESPQVILRSYYTDVCIIDLSPELAVIYLTPECRDFFQFRKMIKSPPSTTARHITKFTKEFLNENKYIELKNADAIILNSWQVSLVEQTIKYYKNKFETEY